MAANLLRHIARAALIIALSTTFGSLAMNASHAATFSQPTTLYSVTNDSPYGGGGFFADLNGDGRPDIITEVATSDPTKYYIQVVLQNADGSYSSPTNYPITQTEAGIAVGDFNGDGIVDIVVATEDGGNRTYTLGFFAGRGDGTFDSEVVLPNTDDVVAITAADMNRDGKMDLVGISEKVDNKERFEVLPGNGDGTFGAGVAQAMLYKSIDTYCVADFNHDGKLDVAASYDTGLSGAFEVSLGQGNGHLGKPTPYVTGTNHEIFSMTAVVLQAGQPPDIAVGEEISNEMAVFPNNGNGSFGTPTIFPNLSACNSVIAGDFNNDGKQDIAAATNAGVFVYTGNGDGTLTPPPGGTGYYLSGRFSFQAIDINGDGNLDIATIPDVEDSITASYIQGKGDGTFRSAIAVTTANRATAIANGDFNGDGKRDIAVATSGTTLAVQIKLGSGDGTFVDGQSYPINVSQGATDPLLIGIYSRDVNNDGKPDLVLIENADNPVIVLLGNGDGTFQAPIYTAATSLPNIGGATCGAVGDFNGDGKIDVALAGPGQSGGDNTLVLFGDGTGHFPTNNAYLAGGAPCYSIAASDLDGNSSLDLVKADYTNNAVDVLLNNGHGVFSPAVSYPAGNAPQSVVAGDFNNDHYQDLAVSNDVDKKVSILLGTGSGSFGSPKSYSTAPNGAGFLALGDFNADGNVDVVATGTILSSVDETGGLSVLYGNGHGGLSAAQPITTAVEPIDAVVGNFNSDAKLDIVTADYYDVSVLLNQPVILDQAKATPHPVQGTMAQLSVDADYDAPGGKAALSYTWSAQGPAAVTYSINGTNQASSTTATFTASGIYKFKVIVTDPAGDTATSTVNVKVTVP